ncbi:MAG: 50S ribosomal protein L18Ae [Candidatus Hydrothermarchaeaceae archaeon]
MVKVFAVKGTFQMGDRMQPFTKECRALNEKSAVEFVYSELGSKHRTPRNKIKILEVKEIKPDDEKEG